ncbi:hypothetical protein CWI37_1395p0010, partial [Hamiltosporidium tvaerminnensis]
LFVGGLFVGGVFVGGVFVGGVFVGGVFVGGVFAGGVFVGGVFVGGVFVGGVFVGGVFVGGVFVGGVFVGGVFVGGEGDFGISPVFGNFDPVLGCSFCSTGFVSCAFSVFFSFESDLFLNSKYPSEAKEIETATIATIKIIFFFSMCAESIKNQHIFFKNSRQQGICLKIQNKKNLPNILDSATILEEENINMNEDLDLEKDNEVVKIVKILFKRKKNRETHNFIIMVQLISVY